MTSVSAIIVTRGDVDIKPIAASLPEEWEVLVWNNELTTCFRWSSDGSFAMFPFSTGLSVYGRYAAIEYASQDLIYVQDDDVIVSDPQAITEAWHRHLFESRGIVESPPHLVANMPQEFRHDGYTDSCLVGFGACFHRDAPRTAFNAFGMHRPNRGPDDGRPTPLTEEEQAVFSRTCDVVFTTLTPRVLVDVPKENLPYATDSNRMYRQPDHVGERARMLELARKVRDA